MDRDGTQNTGSADGVPDSNVVRLPRDWLGPRNELIPLGESAHEAGGAAATNPTADDFWGGSTSVQDPVQKDADSRAPSIFAATLTRLRAAPGPVRQHRWSIIALCTAIGIVVAVAWIGTGARRTDRGLVKEGIEASSPHFSGVQAGLHQRAITRAVTATLSALARSAASDRARLNRARRTAMRHREHSRARSGHAEGSRAIVQQVSASPPASTSLAGSTDEAGPAESSQASQPAQTTSSQPSETTPPAAASSEPPQAISAAGSTSKSGTAGNQPALGANGALAPGSSPDG